MSLIKNFKILFRPLVKATSVSTSEKKTYEGKKARAFTLIELLVVIAIIGILSSVVLASLNGARDSARVARMASDFDQIETAMILWMNQNGRTTWPLETEFSLQQLVDDGAISTIPEPPFGDSYFYDNDGDEFECDNSTFFGVLITVGGVTDDIKREVNQVVENDQTDDGSQDLGCGRIRDNGSGNNFFYSLSDDQSF